MSDEAVPPKEPIPVYVSKLFVGEVFSPVKVLYEAESRDEQYPIKFQYSDLGSFARELLWLAKRYGRALKPLYGDVQSSQGIIHENRFTLGFTLSKEDIQLLAEELRKELEGNKNP